VDGRPGQVNEASPTVSTIATPGAPGQVAAVDGSVAIATAPRQRWRLVLARASSPDAVSGRELTEAWDGAVESTGLPLHRGAGRPKARVQFGAPVPGTIALEHELADVVLAALVPRWQMREALEPVVLDGWRLIDLYDVWPGEPPLAGQIAAADYRIEIGGVPASELAAAAARLLGVRSLPRDKQKGTETVRYDLRPLVADVAVVGDGAPVVVRVRTRFDPALGTGRPEEVVAALGDVIGGPLEIRSTVRERLLTHADLDTPAG
jgi:hypothetical protein